MNHYYFLQDQLRDKCLPLEKVAQYYEECSGAGKEVVFNFVTHLEERKMVGFKGLIYEFALTRHDQFGSHAVTV